MFFATICVYTDRVYKSNSDFIDPMYNELRSQYKNSIPEDLIMNFIIADIPTSQFFLNLIDIFFFFKILSQMRHIMALIIIIWSAQVMEMC